MNTFFIQLFSLLITVIPIVATAQVAVRSAFDDIIKYPEAITNEEHSLDKDPDTNTKTSQYDIYSFELPASKIKLIKNVISAFGKDSQTAYSINQGKISDKDKSEIRLAIGDGDNKNVRITKPNCEYIYALFLAPASEDPEGKYRYAYAMNFKEEDGKLIGNLIVTYATTLKYRQDAERRQSRMLNSEGAMLMELPSEFTSQQTWFDKIMSCLESMTMATTSQMRISLASRTLKLIMDADKKTNATDAEKNVVREILKGMISDKQYYSNNMLYTILNQCLVALK